MHQASARVGVRSSRPYAYHTRPARDRPVFTPAFAKAHARARPTRSHRSGRCVRHRGRRPLLSRRCAGQRATANKPATVSTHTPAEHICIEPSKRARLGAVQRGEPSGSSSIAPNGCVHGTCSLSYRLWARFWMQMSCADSRECGVWADTISRSPSRSRLPVAVASCARKESGGAAGLVEW